METWLLLCLNAAVEKNKWLVQLEDGGGGGKKSEPANPELN